jgi:hypothetical protein
MKEFTKRLTVVLLFSAMLTSCEDGTRTRAEGAGAGAVLGGILGAVIGNQSGSAGEGALIGAAAGGLAGLAYGDHVARKKAAYARTEDYLDACIAQAVAANQRAYEYNLSVESRIRQLEREIARAKAAGDTQELRAKRKEIVSLSNQCEAEINRVSSEIKNQNYALGQGAGAANAGQLRSQITKLESSRQRLEGNNDRLASLSNQIDV